MTKKDDLQKVLHMFDAAQREILLLMKRDSWRRFQNSDEARSIRSFTNNIFAHENFGDAERGKLEAKFHARFDLMSDETLVSPSFFLFFLWSLLAILKNCLCVSK
jgi:hypothetical protein